MEDHGNSTCDKPTVIGCVVEGAVLVNWCRSSGQKTFSDYVKDRILPQLQLQLQDVQRLDIVWDVYIVDSLKATTRQIRGDGSRNKVSDKSLLPE